MMQVQVTAPSRLHFGLLRLPGDDPGRLRAFGGVGLMIDEPGLCLQLAAAQQWAAHGPLAQRALAFAKTFVANSPDLQRSDQAFSLTIRSAPPEHVGLGTGTQLGMSVGRALAMVRGLELDHLELAQRVGRGARSGIGVHGFAHGGLLVDAGKGPHTRIAPLITRLQFPEDWRIVLAIPSGIQGAHGDAERRVFAARSADEKESDTLCRLALMGILPAVVEHDLASFSEALYEFNRRVGEIFRPWQGGIYAHPRITELVEFTRGRGIAAVGQSSWGPSVFAITDRERAQALADDLHTVATTNVILTRASSSGATLGASDQ